MCGIIDLARTRAVTYLSIGQAGESDADVGFSDQADTEAYGYEYLDDTSANVMAFDLGAVGCRDELS